MKRICMLCMLLLLPTILRAQQQSQTGVAQFGSYQSPSFGNINLQNLNFMFSIPVMTSPGRGMNLNFGLSYNSQIWQQQGVWEPVVGPGGQPTWGWNLMSPIGTIPFVHTTAICYTIPHEQRETTTSYGYYSYVEPNGTVHPFTVNYVYIPSGCPGAGTYGTSSGYATDGSGYFISIQSPNSPVVTTPGGAQITLTSFKDTNGNYISSTGVNSNETDWTDSAGRVALKVITGSSSIQYQALDQAGAYQTTTLNFESTNVKTNFGCSGVTEYTSPTAELLPSTLISSNGQSYQFTYEGTPGFSGYVTGRVRVIALASGGQYTLQYGTTHDAVNCSDGSVTNLTMFGNNGAPPGIWTFARTQPNSPNWTTTVAIPDQYNSQFVYTFNTSGQELTHMIYQGPATGTPVREIDTSWATNGTPQSRTVVLEDGVTASETETSFDSFGNLLSLKEHDWGTKTSPGLVLRTTNLTYLTASPYPSLNILNRIITKTVADQTETIQSREDITYDQATGLNTPCISGAAQHDDAHYSCSNTIRGLATSVTTYTNPANQLGGVTKTFTYDSLGNLRTAQLNCCVLKTWNYSSATQYALPDSVVSGPAGGTQLTTSATYNAYTGQVTKSTDENGQSTSMTYDDFGRPLILTRPDTTQITYTYDDTNLVDSVSVPVVGTSARMKSTTLDKIGRPVSVAIEDASKTTYATSETVYDNFSRVTQTSTPHNGGTQSLTTRKYDVLSRLTSVTLPDGSATTYVYNNNMVTVTDPSGKSRKSQTDGLGRITAIFEPDPTNGNALTQQTSYTYTVLNALATVTQGVQTRSYIYDGMGRLTSATTPEAGTVSYQYNTFDLVTKRTDARGVITTYSYDGLNRLAQVSYNVGTTGVPATHSVTYTYGTSQAQFNNGRVITMADGSGTENYFYDLLGRTTQIQKTIGVQNYTTNYAYNLAGELTSITYPSGHVVEQSVDAIGRLCEVAAQTTGCGTSPSPYATGFSYNAASEVTGFNYGNGVTAAFTYSPDRLQLTGLSYSKGTQTLFGLNYWYKQDSTNCPTGQTSNNGQIQCITDLVDAGRTVSYTYDPSGRLAKAVTNGSTSYPQWGLSWTYDRYGNRTAQSISAGCISITCPTNSLSFSNSGGALTNHADNYSYDASGNMTNDGQNTLVVYDGENRVTSSSGSSASGTYSYDGNGLRVEKVAGGTTTVYIFSGAKVIAEYEGSSPSNLNLTREYVYAGGALLASTAGTTTTYYHQDHLSNRLVTDSAGAVVENLGAYPYGESWYNATNDKWAFTSYERDAESGNDYAMARYYVNRFGRFSSPDALSGSALDPQSLNHYSYTENDPVNGADPSGMVTVPLVYLSGGFDGGGFGDDWNEFDMMQIPVQIGTLYQFTGTFNYGNYNLQQLIGYANEGELNLTTSPIYGDFLLFGDSSGGAGGDPAAKGLKAAKLMVLKPNCIRFINNLVFAAGSAIETGASGFEDAMSESSGAASAMVETLSETVYTANSGNPQVGDFTTNAQTNAGSRAVTLYFGYSQLSTTEQGQALIHEGVHDAFGFTDQQLAGALTGTVYPNTSLGQAQASVVFNNALEKNCK